jgi:hypothetical protein
MNPLTLEALAKRVEALEISLAAQQKPTVAKDWHKAVGMFHDSEFMRAVDEECLRLREAEREKARQEEPE